MFWCVAPFCRALNELPRGSTSAVETPNLQPTYEGAPPAPGAASFTIKRWQLQQQRWLVQRVGGTSLLDKLGNNGMASWQFFNVTVRKYKPMDCFNAAYTQVCSLCTSGQPILLWAIAACTCSTLWQLLVQLVVVLKGAWLWKCSLSGLFADQPQLPPSCRTKLVDSECSYASSQYSRG